LTGSTRAGKSVGSQTGEVIKKVVLELGGSDPYIILEDADLDAAVQACAASRLINGGRVVSQTKRFIIVKSVSKNLKNEFVQADARSVWPRRWKWNHPRPIGPSYCGIICACSVNESVSRGAPSLIGGKIPKGPGAFYPPTVLTDVRPGMAGL